MRLDEIITTLMVPGIGRTLYRRFSNYIENAESSNSNELYSWIEQFAADNKRIKLPSFAEFELMSEKAERLIEKNEKEKVFAITPESDDWPAMLNIKKDPPVLLFAKGDVSALSIPYKVAIIGTRTPSEHGSKVAKRLGQVFALEGLCIVSGLANGCDEEGHRGALEASGRTVAVLPSPIDNVMPESNRGLADEIVENGGLLLSEYWSGQIVQRGNYIERDRLQSALSQAVIVVETEKTGGTMHTANYAVEQGRLLSCYKHSDKYIHLPQAEGNKYLLEEKDAMPLASKENIDWLIEKVKKYNILSSEKDDIEQISFLE